METLFSLRQGAALEELIALTAHRGSAESSIKDQYDSESQANQSSFEEKKGELLEDHNSKTTTEKQRYTYQKNLIVGEDESKSKRASMEYEAEQERINDRTQTKLQEAEKQQQEAIWASETVFEAQKDQPDIEHRLTCTFEKEKQVAIEKIEQGFVRLLGRLLVRVPGRDVPEQSENTIDERDDDSSVDLEVQAHKIEIYKDQIEDHFKACEDLLTRRGASLFAQVLVAWHPYALVLGFGGLGTAWAAQEAGWALGEKSAIFAGLGAGVGGAIVLLSFVLTRIRSQKLFREFQNHAGQVQQAGWQAIAAATNLAERRRILLTETRDQELQQTQEKYQPLIDQLKLKNHDRLEQIDKAYQSRLRVLLERRTSRLDKLERNHDQVTRDFEDRFKTDMKDLNEGYERRRDEAQQRFEEQWGALETKWRKGMTEVFATFEQIGEASTRFFPEWTDPSWSQWSPPLESFPAIRFGTIHVDRALLEGGLPRDERLVVPGPTEITLPASLVFPRNCSMFVEYGDAGREETISLLQNVMLRLLTSLPPGKVRFTVIDPVGLGQSFAGFMHLADYDEAIVGSRIWTESRHIEQRLADLTEHIENVIQKYLRNEFENIAQYNVQAGEIAEPYRFLVISDLPVGFNETSARRLMSIITSGARCGLHTLIGFDKRHAKLPVGMELNDLRQHALQLTFSEGRFCWNDDLYQAFPLTVDQPPDDESIIRILQAVGEGAQQSARVEVPFEIITPPEDKLWSRSTAKEIRVPLGRAGATKLQNLVLGHGTSQHVLIAGKTGSGKSTMLHGLITNLALWSSPDEVEFYLVDFKKGVEFKAYATHQLPHARVIAIESDREFGLSVLQRVDGELKRRGKLFREIETQDLAGFRKKMPDVPMPRVMLIIDEFQELFVEDDKVAQDAALLMDRLVRQGRAFGIHVLLGSQTLGGAYSLARSTLGQMAVRIALQCSEADSYLILSDDNSAARLLARPGEAIYNDASGMVEGNNPFQIAWLSDTQRDECLQRVTKLAKEHNYRPPGRLVVFEGNIPADVEQNNLLNNLLERDDWPQTPKAISAWLGDAIAIKDPTSVKFRRQSGSNLVIVGQQEESALAILAMSIISIAAQHDPGSAKFILLDGSPSDSPLAGYLQQLADHLPHEVRCVGWREVESLYAELDAEYAQREETDDTSAPAIYIVLYGLQRYRMLRISEDFSFSMDEEGKSPSPDKLFARILREGPNFGMHTLLWSDTLINLERTVDRNSMREFDNRVLFQMSATDSTNLIDSPVASKMGIRRTLLYNEEQGQLEKFRAYALPDESWLNLVRDRLGRRDRANLNSTES